MSLSLRHRARSAVQTSFIATAIIALVGGALIVSPAQAKTTPADLPLISTSTTSWRYLDNATDPAGTASDARVWTKTGFDDSAWKTGSGRFGQKNGVSTGMGGGLGIDTLLTRYIPDTSTDVPTYFFRTSFTLTAEQAATIVSLKGSATYDDGLVIYLNGQKVQGFEDSGITQNLQYGGSNGADPDVSSLSIAPTALVAGTNTIAIALYQCNATSSDIYFDLSSLRATFATPAATISDLNLNVGADQTQRNVTWYTSQAAAQSVQVAKKADVVGGNFPAATATSFPATSGPTTDSQFSQKAVIAGLAEDTTYVYRVGDAINGWSPTYEFATHKFTGDYNFLFIGDAQIGASGNVSSDQAGWTNTLNTAETKFPNTEFIFSVGDQVNNAADEAQYAAFLAPEQLRRIPLATLAGNHDVGSKAYEQHFTMPNWDPSAGAASSGSSAGGDYWFRYNDTLYVSLNSNSMDYASHKAFMTTVVAEQGASAKWKVLTFHHSIYSVAAHTDDSDIVDRRANMPETISDLGFDLVLMGHDHSYTRSWLMNKGVVDETGGVAQSVVKAKEGDVLYVTANSSSGSKYYAVKAPNSPFAAVINQEQKRNYSSIEVKDASITITTYRSDDNTIVDQVALERADVTKPELTVPTTDQIAFGSEFSPLAGVTATDAHDGDLTSKVTVTGTVNTNALGTTELTYSVTDSAGNTATATRTVTVVEATFATATPTIVGKMAVGSTLTAKPGAWAPVPTAVTYQWLRNDAVISGATKATYTAVAADAGRRITVKVTSRRLGYLTASTTSASSAASIVATGTLKTTKPSISGKAKVGKTLTVKAGAWSPKPTMSYRWYANGKALKKATSTKLKLTTKLKGKKITVRVTGRLSGYATATVASGSTKKVAKK